MALPFPSTRDATAWGVAALIGVAAAVAVATERGVFWRDAGPADVLPGLTLGDDGARAMPVVTSLRSGGRAERAGLRVGDRIVDIDGTPVRSVAMLRSAMRDDPARVVALHVVRGDATWRTAIDRIDPRRPWGRHDAQDTPG